MYIKYKLKTFKNHNLNVKYILIKIIIGFFMNKL